MPRSQLPRRNQFGFLRYQDDEELADNACLSSDEDDCRRLMTEVTRLVDDYYASWTPGRGPGRRDEKRRNDLIVAIAEVFQKRSGWSDDGSAAARQDYLASLTRFISLVLAYNEVFPVPLVSLRRKIIPRHLRVPR